MTAANQIHERNQRLMRGRPESVGVAQQHRGNRGKGLPAEKISWALPFIKRKRQVKMGPNADAHVRVWADTFPCGIELDLLSPLSVAKEGNIRSIRVKDILRVVAKHYNVTCADILSRRRTDKIVKPRQVAMYLAKTLTLRSLPEIGRVLGGRDHTTVLHGARKIDGLIQTDHSLAWEVQQIRSVIEAQHKKVREASE